MSTIPSAPEAAPPALPPPLPAPAGAGPRLPKNPWVAMLLSFIFPGGLGQVYNGQIAKALVFFFGEVGSIYGAAEVGPFPFAFLIPFIFFFNIVDAWRTASLINARHTGGAVEAEETVESPAWGITLVVLGLVLLLNNLGWLDLAALQRYWPLLLVAAGVAFIRSAARRRQQPASRNEDEASPL
jgi:hypothetical protein